MTAEKDAEIERLKAELAHAEENLYKAGVRLGVMSVQLGNRDKLIGELADALEGTGHRMPVGPCNVCDLIERARKAVK